ncbi:MAG: DUF4203 domain-containing protein [Chloroflexi bacterium]|nr:DUF4203 domain-containing protein [Chloroflexota bacterium]
MDYLAGLVAIALGLSLLFFGFNLWLSLLPVIGFFVGFVSGTALVSWLLGDGFLANVLGIGAGVVVAVAFAVLAIVWWWAGVIVAIGGLGFSIGFGVLPWIGLNVTFLSVLIGLAVGAAFALLAIVLRLPRALVIVSTSLWGAAGVLAGIMLFLGIIDAADLGFGAVNEVLSESLLWSIAWIILAFVGMAEQTVTTEAVSLVPDDAGAPPMAPRPPAAPAG